MISILILCIISLLVAKPDGTTIYNYLSFASAISSIILAVVAIFYSMISNEGFSNTLSEIRSSSSKIVEETARLQSASIGLSQEVEDSLKRASLIPDHIDKMSSEIAKQFERLETEKIPPENGEKESNEGFSPVGKPLSIFLSVLIASLSYRHTTSFDIEKIFSEDMSNLTESQAGIFSAIKYFEACGIKIDGLSGRYIVRDIGNIDPEQIISRAKDIKEEASYFIEAKRQVLDFFGEPHDIPQPEVSADENEPRK